MSSCLAMQSRHKNQQNKKYSQEMFHNMNGIPVKTTGVGPEITCQHERIPIKHLLVMQITVSSAVQKIHCNTQSAPN